MHCKGSIYAEYCRFVLYRMFYIFFTVFCLIIQSYASYNVQFASTYQIYDKEKSLYGHASFQHQFSSPVKKEEHNTVISVSPIPKNGNNYADPFCSYQSDRNTKKIALTCPSIHSINFDSFFSTWFGMTNVRILVSENDSIVHLSRTEISNASNIPYTTNMEIESRKISLLTSPPPSRQSQSPPTRRRPTALSVETKKEAHSPDTLSSLFSNPDRIKFLFADQDQRSTPLSPTVFAFTNSPMFDDHAPPLEETHYSSELYYPLSQERDSPPQHGVLFPTDDVRPITLKTPNTNLFLFSSNFAEFISAFITEAHCTIGSLSPPFLAFNPLMALNVRIINPGNQHSTEFPAIVAPHHLLELTRIDADNIYIQQRSPAPYEKGLVYNYAITRETGTINKITIYDTNTSQIMPNDRLLSMIAVSEIQTTP